jgi:ABC-2 type transport system ATP-binding protein
LAAKPSPSAEVRDVNLDQREKGSMAVVEVSHLSYSYGHVAALRDLDLSIPEGALYALLGPNGSGKTTLVQILMGLRRPRSGRVSIMGVDSSALTVRDRGMIGYIAEGQPLPGWMRLEQLEAYLAPLYPTWDASLARELRDRFDLDPARKIQTLSRGENMKAALLCALAPRPRLLLMDEPFTGMDALVKDELVRGLLASVRAEGWTVLLSSHDIGELELLADWVGFLDRGRMALSEPMDVLRQRFKRVDIVLEDDSPESAADDWMSVERSGRQLGFVVPNAVEDLVPRMLAPRFPRAARIDVRDATLREVFVALASRSRGSGQREVAA